MNLRNGRFRGRLHPLALKFSSSLHIDKHLYREDIEGSLAHVAMLAKQKIIPLKDAKRLRSILREIRQEIEKGRFLSDKPGTVNQRFAAEDVHMAIEQRLIKKLGEIGGRLHTARSRNDQVALDERLFLRRAIRQIFGHLRRLQQQLVKLAGRYRDVIMPAYTHLQRAQPVLLAHHVLAYVSMLERDHQRFADCFARVNRSPLGACAATGTSFPIDRLYVAKQLHLSGIVENSIDAVSDRDVQLETISHCAITMMHLSRFAEELVLWSSREWGFIEIGDAFTTGSSIMPQKKNPDMAELIRGKTGRVYGDLIALLTVMKGLPLAYNRDMQEDKEPLFDAVGTLSDCLQVLTHMLKTISVHRSRFEVELDSDDLLATELVDYLARKGLPFRKAHVIIGQIVRACEVKKTSLKQLTLKDYQHYSELFGKDVYSTINARSSILHKQSAGSTSPKEVAKAIAGWKKKLK